MRRKWAIALVLMPIGMYACGTELSIPPDLSDGGDGAADAMGDSSPDGGPTCTPKTCGEVGAQCGSAPNGCGGKLADCGVCAVGELCGGGGTNRCGDAGCDAATSCVGRCGTISNGCGGTLACEGCPGASYCADNSGTCAPCMVFELSCTSDPVVTCNAPPVGTYKTYSCEQAPDLMKGCTLCKGGFGSGPIYCCP